MPVCEDCGREFESKRGLSVHRRSCKPKGMGAMAEKGAARDSATPGSEAVVPVDPFVAWVRENLQILSANDESLQAAVDEIRGMLSTTREPGATPQWVDNIGGEVQKQTPEIIGTLLSMVKNFGAPSESELFGFTVEEKEDMRSMYKEYLGQRMSVMSTLMEKLKAGKVVVE